MAGLSKADILGADDLAIIEVEVEEWGGSVGIRELTSDEKDGFEASVATVPDEDATPAQREKALRRSLAGIRARFLALVLCDIKTGERLFSNAEAKELGQKSGKVCTRLFELAREHNGISEEDVQELAGNSADESSDDSPGD